MASTARGSYAKSAEVRRGIIEACAAAFGESGFHGVSMAEIARRAGISHTGLLHHFPRKEDLLTAVLELQDQRTAQFLAEHATLGDAEDPVALLRGMVTAMADRGRSAGLVELAAVLTGEATVRAHPAHEYFQNRFTEIRRFMTRLYRTLDEHGRLRSDLPPELLATTTIAVMDGLHTQWLYAPDEIDLDAMVSAYLAELIIGFEQ